MHYGSCSDGEQIVFLRHSQYTLALYYDAAMMKFCRDAPESITPMVFDGYFLYRGRCGEFRRLMGSIATYLTKDSANVWMVINP